MIVVEDLVIKYAPELPAVLKNVSFSLKAGERVGLLGRTGSGKSTLAMSILRFVDPTSGRIIIDGIDISTIGLYDLRSRIVRSAVLFVQQHWADCFPDFHSSGCHPLLRHTARQPRPVP